MNHITVLLSIYYKSTDKVSKDNNWPILLFYFQHIIKMEHLTTNLKSRKTNSCKVIENYSHVIC